MTDEELAVRAQAGDQSATRALLEKYKKAVKSVARSFFLEGGDAEDLAQEGMIGLYLAITDFREGGMSFKNFAYLCINRRIVGAVRSATRKKHEPLNGSVPLPDGDEGDIASAEDPEAELIGNEEREELLQAVKNALSESEYESLRLYMEGMSIGEIAAERGVGEKSAENAVQRAKKKVSALLSARAR